MAKTKRRSSYQAKLVKHLAAVFPVGDVPMDDPHLSDLSGMLGLLETEAKMMVDLGAFGVVTGEMPNTQQVLRFLEQHGRAWVLGRLEAQLERIRNVLEGPRGMMP